MASSSAFIYALFYELFRDFLSICASVTNCRLSVPLRLNPFQDFPGKREKPKKKTHWKFTTFSTLKIEMLGRAFNWIMGLLSREIWIFLCLSHVFQQLLLYKILVLNFSFNLMKMTWKARVDYLNNVVWQWCMYHERKKLKVKFNKKKCQRVLPHRIVECHLWVNIHNYFIQLFSNSCHSVRLFVIYSTIHHTKKFLFYLENKSTCSRLQHFTRFFLYTNHIKELLLSITVKLSYSVLVPRHFLGDFFNFHKQFSMLKVLFCLFFAYKKLFLLALQTKLIKKLSEAEQKKLSDHFYFANLSTKGGTLKEIFSPLFIYFLFVLRWKQNSFTMGLFW